MQIPKNRRHTSTEEINLYELWMVLWKRRKIIVGVVSICVVISILISLLITQRYVAVTTVLPISSNTVFSSNQIKSALLANMSMSTLEDDTQKILAVLQSRTIREGVIKKLDLHKSFSKGVPADRDSLLAATEKLRGMTQISHDNKTGLIVIFVNSNSAEQAKDIANTYVKELQDLLNSKAFSVTRMRREFIEEQLRNVEKRLKDDQKRMARFQNKSKILLPKEQFKGTMGLYSNLMAKKTELEVRLKSMELALAPDSTIVKSIRAQLAIINNKIRNIEGGGKRSAILSMNNAPIGMLRYGELYQNLEITKTIYETLVKLYEQSKIEEAQQSLFVQVIDPAIKPDIRSWPRRKLIVGFTGSISLIFMIFSIFFFEWLRKARNEYNERNL